MSELNKIVFYQIDKAIRSYRHLAQNRFRKIGIDITVDQWIILKTLQENPACSQSELAEKVFKDNASITRMLDLLVKHKYLNRAILKTDRRRTLLKITDLGQLEMDKMQPLILENRSIALANISPEDLEIARSVMNKIASNCSEFKEKEDR